MLIFASTGDEAIQKIKASPVDMVILDIKMPKKDGLETLKELKKLKPSATLFHTSALYKKPPRHIIAI